VNDELVNLIDASAVIASKLAQLESGRCPTCLIFEKQLGKIEKIMVKLQIRESQLSLDAENKKDIIRKLHPRGKLPPLSVEVF
jgi:hypothetical protein